MNSGDYLGIDINMYGHVWMMIIMQNYTMDTYVGLALGCTSTMKYSFKFLEGVDLFTKHQHILFGKNESGDLLTCLPLYHCHRLRLYAARSSEHEHQRGRDNADVRDP